MSGSLALLCLELLFTKPQDRKLTLPRWYETLAASYCKAHGLSADAFSSALHLAIFVSVSAGVPLAPAFRATRIMGLRPSPRSFKPNRMAPHQRSNQPNPSLR